MLEKPDLDDQLLILHLQNEYGIDAEEVTFLPLGADVNTAVYRAVATGGREYFLKLRKGLFDPITVTLPQFLNRQGIRAVIAPLNSRSGLGWSDLGEYKSIVYPFVEGKDGYEVPLSAEQWTELGVSMRAVHDTRLPDALAVQIPREGYTPHWREKANRFLALAGRNSSGDPISRDLAAFMRGNRAKILHMIRRAGELAGQMQAQRPEFVLCHADLHPGNLHISAVGQLYIVDWDNPRFAPKEIDLMFSGGPENLAFYQGYGKVQIDKTALAYYRYERVVVDIAEFAEAIFQSTVSEEDRRQSYVYMTGSFLPGHDVELAFRSDPLSPQRF